METRLFFIAILMLATLSLEAQYTLEAGSGSGEPGDTVEVSITLDADQASFGFSFGLTHDDAMATLDAIGQGADVASVNDEEGADFFFLDIDPTGGPGGWVICILSETGDAELPGENGLELAVFEYTIDSEADVGTSGDLEFTNDLGDPPVSTVVSDGDTYEPETNDGVINVQVPPVDDLACNVSNPCDCEFTVSWTNAGGYDQIEVLRGPTTVATLAGDATSYTETLPSDSVVFSVIPSANGEEGPPQLCFVSCPDIPEADPPENLSCLTLPSCEVTLQWENPQTFGEFEVLLDGKLEGTVQGDQTEFSFTVPEELTEYEVTLAATDICDMDAGSISCTVLCDPDATVFLRGDGDGNGTVFALIDGLYLMRFAFDGGEAPPCDDAADVNDDGEVFVIIDALELLQWAFGDDTLLPPSPGPEQCGVDPTDDDTIDCAVSQENCP